MMLTKCTLVNSPAPPDVRSDPHSKLKIAERERRQHNRVAEALETDGAGGIQAPPFPHCKNLCKLLNLPAALLTLPAKWE